SAAREGALEVYELVVGLAQQGLLVLRLGAERADFLLQLEAERLAALGALGEQGLELPLLRVLGGFLVAVGAVQGGLDQAVQDVDGVVLARVHWGPPRLGNGRTTTGKAHCSRRTQPRASLF